ncbi:MAG TPA: GSCFA domain-containing protein [Cyclobacteriaceae bacterium]|nr:GSCFA domain-containing protein [Cyclobacteriaceae bacterium]
MEWRTELQVKPVKNKISLGHTIFTIGSCFSDEIGHLLLQNKFTVSKNPFGTIYNPLSIHQLLHFGLDNQFPKKDTYSTNKEIHFNYHFHSSFSSLSKDDLKDKVEKSIGDSHSFLKSADRIIITYGTAFGHYLRGTTNVVANCHKMPSINFDKSYIDQSTIVQSFQEFYNKIKSINPSVKFVVTVSPVRHLKDTLESNAVSKSLLRVSCESLANAYTDVDYFPAYEIMLDDLRDYRFYKSDLLHPSDDAVGYIWEKFVNAYFDEPAKKFIADWKKITNDLAHRPFQPRSEGHVKFLKSILDELDKWEGAVDVNRERSEVLQRIRQSSE